MLRLALSFVSSQAVAEEVVQDTWLAVLRGLGRFEEGSSLRTWLFTILVNRARSTGVREARTVPVADAGPVVDASRFGPNGAWAVPPEHWVEEAENRIDAVKLSGLLRGGLDGLPVRQRDVVLLRDVEGMKSAEVCQALAISEGNQRVLLHRGRSKLRQVLERNREVGRDLSFLSGLLRFRPRPGEVPCQEVVEMVTDYLEGALPSAGPTPP